MLVNGIEKKFVDDEMQLLASPMNEQAQCGLLRYDNQQYGGV
jgi:hypothetical protein